MNHSSEEHRWFKEALKDKNSEYRDFYIWTKDPKNTYSSVKIIFSDTCVTIISSFQRLNSFI